MNRCFVVAVCRLIVRIPENSADSYLFLTGFISLSVILHFPISINFFIFMHAF